MLSSFSASGANATRRRGFSSFGGNSMSRSGVPRCVAAGRGDRPGVDRGGDGDERRDARAREARVAEPVAPHLPLELADVVGWERAELRSQEVAIGSGVVAERRRAVGLAASLPTADSSGLHAVEPFIADALERAGRLRLFARVTGSSLPDAKPGEHLTAVLRHRLLPLGFTGHRVAAPTTPRGLAPTAGVVIVEGWASHLMGDVHASVLVLRQLAMALVVRAPRKLAPGDTRGDTAVSPYSADLAVKSGCRRRDSNPRHADYDSAALWLYRAVCGAGGHERGHIRAARQRDWSCRQL
jgi:hypothetical protein